MKKYVFFILCTLILFCCVSCATNIHKRNKDGSPIWTTEIPKNNRKIYGIGKAKFSTESISTAAAETNAKADLARKLQSTMKDFTAIYAKDSDGENKNAYERLTVEVVNFTLKGITIEDQWTAGDGTCWMLVSIKIKDVPALYETVGKSYQENNESLGDIKLNVEVYLENVGYDLSEDDAE